MKTITITGTLREKTGKKNAMALRRKGQVLCTLYGGKGQVFFHAHENEFRKLVHTPDIHQVKLDVGGRQYDAIMQDVQLHPVTDFILHIDFLEVVPGKPVIMEIPVRTEGFAPGVKGGGKLKIKLRKVKAKGPIEKMPQTITLNVDALEVGDSIMIKDLIYDGVTFLHEPNATIVGVRITREVEETPATAPVAGTEGTVAATTVTAPVPESKKEEKK